MNIEVIVQQLKRICQEASKAILIIYNDQHEVYTKDDQSPVTDADLASNSIIVAGLKELYEGIPIISEESAKDPYDIRKNYTYCWMVDPLDGTKEFIKKNGEFSINIAMLRNGIPVLGVLAMPVLNRFYYAVKGQGAFSEDLHHSENKVRVTSQQVDFKDSGIKTLVSRSHINEATQKLLMHLDRPEVIPCGSAYKFARIAEGSAQFYPRLGPTMEWDTAAAQIIVEEAGGFMLDMNTGNPLIYNKEALLNPNFVVIGKCSDLPSFILNKDEV